MFNTAKKKTAEDSGGKFVAPPRPIEKRADDKSLILELEMVIGDRRKFISCTHVPMATTVRQSRGPGESNLHPTPN